MRFSFLYVVVALAVGCAEGESQITRDGLGDPNTQLMQPESDGGLEDTSTPVVPEADAEAADAMPPEPEPEPDPDDGLPPDPNVNLGWIGGPCEADEDCDYADHPGGFCLSDAEGYPRGTCSLGCDRVCPDVAGLPVTFCIDDVIVGQGACVQRCDYTFFADSGCRPGYYCESRPRYNETAFRRGVCVPGEPDLGPDLGCFEEMEQRALDYVRQTPRQDSPRGRPDVTCDIDGPVTLRSPVGGVSYRYVTQAESRPMFMSCHLANALDRLSQLLEEFDVVEVGHIGTYNCRLISGTNTLSQHGLGFAIDLKWFRRSDGFVFDVEDHWEHGVTENFATEEGALLYSLAWQMHTRQIFNIVLTPNFNAAHDNHFHVDLTENSNFIRSGGGGYHFGPNIDGD